MIREHERYFSPIIFFFDCLFIILSYVLSVSLYMKLLHALHPYVRFGIIGASSIYWDRYLLTLPFFFMIFVFFYQFWYRHRVLQAKKIKTMALQTAIPCLFTGLIFMAFVLVNYSFREDIWLVFAFVFFSWVFLMMDRLLVLLYIRMEQKKGRYTKYLLIAGTGERAVKAAGLFEGNPGWGFEVLGFLTNEKTEVGREISHYKVLGLVDDLPQILEKNVVDTIFFTGGTDSTTQIRNLANRCEMIGIDFVLDVSTLLAKTIGVSAEPLQDMSTILFKPLPYSPEKLFLKRVFDVTVSGILIALCTPFWIIIPLLIKRDSPGPALYIQDRIGKHGRPFKMFKFRTMVSGADKMLEKVMHLNEMDGPVFKIKEDPRHTRIGKLLRSTSLDELPQLFNVFFGTMSLVGPRPPILKEVLQYRPWQRKRLSVTQGVTCLWQVSGRNEIKFDEWMKLDLQYIENWSLTLDFKIILMTVKAVLSRKGAA
ncbi:MAG TPA: sugar transferase [Syntrophorhabdaceae bacterium]|jgi:exopolysaccharide biosynthesis polyprenyl glycosylphosphotransferase